MKFYSSIQTPRVVYVMPTFSAGGAERIVYELAARLPLHGFHIEVVSLMGGGPLEALFDAASIPYVMFERRGPFGVGGFFHLQSYLTRTRPHIVHTHLFGADLWGRLAAALARTPNIVMTEQNVHPEFGVVKREINRSLAGITDVCVALSCAVKRDMIARMRIPSKKIRVIRGGIDMRCVLPRPPRAFRDPPRLITIGRLAPQKGHTILLQALARVRRPWTLDIVGAGPQESELRALAERLGLAPRLRWLGYRDDVPRLLAQSDLFCFPSLWEGLGLALIEALAAAVPSVASDLPVFREEFGDMITSYAAVGDVSTLADAIEGVLQNPSSALQRAQSATETIRSAFSADQMVAAHADMYRQLLRASHT